MLETKKGKKAQEDDRAAQRQQELDDAATSARQDLVALEQELREPSILTAMCAMLTGASTARALVGRLCHRAAAAIRVRSRAVHAHPHPWTAPRCRQCPGLVQRVARRAGAWRRARRRRPG